MKDSQMFGILANSSIAGAYIYQGKDGKIVFANKHLADMLGYKKDELLGRSLFDIYANSKEELQGYVNKRIKKDSSPEHLNFTLMSKTGRFIYVEELVHSIDYNGKTSGLVILIDKTKEKSFEKLFYALSQINQIAIRTEDEDELLIQICSLLVDTVGYFALSIGSVDETTKLFKIKYVKSKSKELEKTLKKTVIGVDPNTPYGRGSVSKAYATGKVILLSEVIKKADMDYWRKEQRRFGIYSACSIPIFKDNVIKYILLIHDNVKGSFNQEHLHLLNEIQADISFALGKMERRKKLIKQQEQLKIQSRVYNTLYHLNRISMESKNEDEFLKNLPSIFTEYLEADVSFIAKIKEDALDISYKSIKDSSIEEFLKVVEDLLNNPPKELNKNKIPFIKAYKDKRVYLINDLPKYGSSVFKPYHKVYNINSCCALPIIKSGKAMYSISLLSKHKNLFNASIYNLLNAVCKEIEFILDRFEQDKFAQMMNIATSIGFDFIGIADENFNFIYINNKMKEVLQYTEEELSEKHKDMFSPKSMVRGKAKDFYKKLQNGKSISDIMIWNVKNGGSIKVFANIVPYKLGNDVYYITSAKDITNELYLQQHVENVVNYDSLTHLMNRNTFKKEISNFIKRAKYENLIGVIFIINPIRFSNINQAFGFEAGNGILIEISNRLKNFLREYDTIAKLESDKFGILLKDIKNEEDIFVIIVKLINKLSEPYVIGDKIINISFNAGVSIYPKDAEDTEMLVERAEIALLDVKHKEESLGFYKEELKEIVQKKIKLKSAMSQALKNREFILYYQPYFNAKTRKIEGAEALIRWKKEGKIVPPMEFIPYLEETGMISAVEDWILEKVSSKQKQWKEKKIKPIPVSINISPASFTRKDFADNLISNTMALDADPKLINLEIIERLFIDNTDYVNSTLNRLKQHGFKFSLDDFGTGYSSLSYLSSLPINYLKIDISFIRKMLSDSNTKAIVKTTISLSKDLNLKTIAEGVETKEQFDMLKSMGCDYIQGYYFSKPLPEEEFEELLFNT